MKAVIFDIQNTSYVDGPGIRTTVFFKGCNLRCLWCHNPEGLSPEPQLLKYKKKCTGCGMCAEVCVRKPCALCGRCGQVCPNSARKLCGEELTLDQVFSRIQGEKAFFDASRGGVTCSGGECMLQTDFVRELLRLCKQDGIHTAIDTAGHVPWSSFEKVLPYADLFLYDIKCIDPTLHEEGTGVDNTLILANYRRLVHNARVCARIPCIEGFNVGGDELERIAGFLRKYPPAGIEALPFHNMGGHKYDALGMARGSFSVPPDMEAVRRALHCPARTMGMV